MPNPKSKDVVLLCNPQAGGRWKALADVLDSEETHAVRRIVTDEIDDVREAISGLGQRVNLMCIYGGDGTIFRVLAELIGHMDKSGHVPQLAFLGGGTMNVTSRWCGMGSSPGDNFRAVMRAYMADRLFSREVALLKVQTGKQSTHYGFTCGLGPLVRILEQYEGGDKGRIQALLLGARTILAAISSLPRSYKKVLREMDGTVTVDEHLLPYRKYSAVFCNVTGAINPLIEPFIGQRTRDTFYFLAYASTSREFAMLAPLLARAHRPIDPKALLRPISTWRQVGLSLFGEGELPIDPRYVNHPARRLIVHTDEKHYTMDGELLPIEDGYVRVELGPAVRLVTRSE